MEIWKFWLRTMMDYLLRVFVHSQKWLKNSGMWCSSGAWFTEVGTRTRDHDRVANTPEKSQLYGWCGGIECSGTPVDCVKLAKNVLYKNDEISFCFSGINHGSNASINIIYSGTMWLRWKHLWREFRRLDSRFWIMDMTQTSSLPSIMLGKSLAHCMKNGFGNTMLLNVNIPKMGVDDIKGIKICRQSKAGWKEIQEGVDPRGQKYYCWAGTFVHDDPGTDDDWTAWKKVDLSP